MKISQRKQIAPLPIEEQNEELSLFKDRATLHTDRIPEFFVYLSEEAWEKFHIHTTKVYQATHNEGQGIFLGKYFKDDFGEFIIAEFYEEGEGAATYTSVQMSEECLARISKKCSEQDLLMLIWIHTHPNMGVFYSGTDVNCLLTNFYKPFQIGIVADIVRKETRGFKVRQNQVIEFSNYCLYNASERNLLTPYKKGNITGAMEIKKKTDSMDTTVNVQKTSIDILNKIHQEIIKTQRLIGQSNVENSGQMSSGVLENILIDLNKELSDIRSLLSEESEMIPGIIDNSLNNQNDFIEKKFDAAEEKFSPELQMISQHLLIIAGELKRQRKLNLIALIVIGCTFLFFIIIYLTNSLIIR